MHARTARSCPAAKKQALLDGWPEVTIKPGATGQVGLP
jgi:hypothetical protein